MRLLPVFAFAIVGIAALSAQTPSVIPPPPDVAAPPADATKTASGLATKVLQPGTGKDHPERGRRRHRPLHRLDDRRQDVRQLGRPRASRRPSRSNRVIAGWTEGLQLMVDRRKAPPLDSRSARLQGRSASRRACSCSTSSCSSIPSARRRPTSRRRRPTRRRPRAASPTRCCKQGTGGRHPDGRPSKVTVHYTGWTTDGKMFDSSVVARPAARRSRSTASSPAGPKACS